MKKSAFVLVLVAGALAATLWLALGRSEGTRGLTKAPASSEASLAADPAPRPELTAPPEPVPEAPTPTSAPTPEPEARREAATDGSGRRIAGRVQLPQAAPADETLRVHALREAFAPAVIYGRRGVLEELARGEKTRALASAPVRADGSFELALGTDDAVWLALDGRFLYSAAAERVPAESASVELSAELGGSLAGRVRLPGDARDFAELDLELGADAQQFSMARIGVAPLFERTARLDDEGRFELRALPVGLAHALQVETDAYADAEVTGLEFEPGRVREVEVALVHGATLRGSVRDESGAPVAAAEVAARATAIWGFPGEELSEVKSDANGAFELAHVRPGKCLLIASLDGRLDSEALKLELADGEQRAGLELVLTRGAVIAGEVRLAGGGALEGAGVQVTFDPEALSGMGAFNAARGASGRSQSSADGRFEVSGLGKGPFRVEASLERTAADGAKETWRARVSAIKPDTRDLVLELAAPIALSGRVQSLAGAPVPEFQVRAVEASGIAWIPGESRQERCVDPEGDFVLRGLAAGQWTLDASAEGFGPMTPLELTLPRATDEPLVLVLTPAATIAGTVLDPQGKPVGGALVTLHAELQERIQRVQDSADTPEATSAEDGSFLLGDLASGTSTILAQRDGFAASEPAAVVATPEAPASGVVLRLRKGALLTGEVYGPDEKLAAGVQVIAQEPGTMEVSMGRTDGTGRFRFEHLVPGPWTVTAMLDLAAVETEGSQAEVSASFLENMRFAMVTLEDGEEEHVVLGAPPKDPVLVRGTVRHGDEGVSEGMVSFVAEGSKGLEALKIAPLGADGRYETQLTQPGRYLVTVQITAGGGTFQQNSVEFNETIPQKPEHVLDLALPLAALRGTVRVPEGASAAGTRVTLAAEGGLEIGTMMGGQYAEATTDEHGRYSFDYLRPGTYAVAAGGALFGGAFGSTSQAGRLVKSGLRVDEGQVLEGVDFTLEQPGDIEGRVVDTTGAAVKDAAIFVRDASGRLLDRLSMIVSGADGAFTYSGVAPGEYVVSARGNGLASVESAPVRVEKGGKARVELVLMSATKLFVEVVDDEGAPVRARVSVLDARGREMQGMLGWAEMMGAFGESGFDFSKQELGPLAPGTYTVTAIDDGGHKSSKPVTLDGQPERRLKLRLR
jgi:protocatechuate 3,4-dioxygenase beta subunit